ncbi:hypothetical protein DSECCO2_461440 [anaerobic digester metagenome]
MIKNLAIFLTIFIPIIAVGQSIEFYRFSLSTAYLPSCGSQSELYLKENNKTSRKATKRSWKHCKRIKRNNLPKDKSIEKAINLLDSLMRLEEYMFIVNPTLINTINSQDSKKNYFKITDKDIDDFFNKGDTVILKKNSIKQDFLEGMVIDGAPYWYELVFKRNGQDSIKYAFGGNFLDDVQTSNIIYWLPMYLTYKKYPFFGSIKLVEEYFNDEQLESVLFRFIAWTKKE